MRPAVKSSSRHPEILDEICFCEAIHVTIHHSWLRRRIHTLLGREAAASLHKKPEFKMWLSVSSSSLSSALEFASAAH